MLKNISHSFRKNILAIITILIVIATFFTYYNVYMPAREDQINAGKFRVLSRLNDNINKQYEALDIYSENIKRDIEKHYSRGLSITSEFKASGQRRNYDSLKSIDVAKKNQVAILDTSMFDANNKGPGNIKVSIKKMTLNDFLKEYVPNDSSDRIKNPRANLGSNISNDHGRSFLERLIAFYEFPAIDNNDPDSVYAVVAKWDWQNFIQNLLRPDFKYYALKAGNKLIFNSASNAGLTLDEISPERTVVLKTNGSKTIYSDLDTLAKLFSGSSLSARTSKILNINLSGSIYRLYLLPTENTDNGKLTLCGLVPEREINDDKRRIPDNVVYSMLLIIFLFILSMPFLKLALMNQVERLNSWDLINSIVAFMIATVLITSFVLYDRESSYDLRKNVEPQLDAIGNQLSKSYLREIESACFILSQCDTKRATQHQLDSSYLIKKDSIIIKYDEKAKGKYERSTTLFPDHDAKRWLTEAGKKLNLVFWLNDNGDQLYAWSRFESEFNHNNYAERDYFKAIRDNKADYKAGCDGCNGRVFFINPVISWTAGIQRTVISSKSISNNAWTEGGNGDLHDDSAAVACISIKPLSVMKPLIPPGYGFAIINKRGDVLYSSDEKRNLNENLLEECSDSSDLKGAMNSRTSECFTSEYHGEECYFQIRPIGLLPFYMVTYHSNIYNQTLRDQTMFFTHTMMIIVFLFILLLMFIIAVVKKPGSRLIARPIRLNWLWPVKEKTKFYRETIGFNLIVIIVTFLFYLFISLSVFAHNCSALLLYLFLLSILFTTYHVYRQYNYPEPLSFWSSFKEGIFVSLMVLATIMIISAFHFTYSSWILMAYSGIMLLLIFKWKAFMSRLLKIAASVSGWQESDVMENLKLRRHSPIKLCCMIFVSWLFISCILPTACFLKTGILQEKIRQVKDYQIQLSENYYSHKDYFNDYLKPKDAKGISLIPFYANDHINEKSTPPDTCRKNGFLGETFDSLSVLDFCNDPGIDEFYQQLMSYIHVFHNPLIVRQNYLGKKGSEDGPPPTLNWKKDHSTIIFHHRGNDPGPDVHQWLLIKSNIDYVGMFRFKGYITIMYLISILLVLLIMYFVVKFIIRKYFQVNLHSINYDRNVLKSILIGEMSYRQIFINGLPGSGKFTQIKEILEKAGKKYEVITFLNVPDHLTEKEEINNAKLEQLFPLKLKAYEKDYIIIRDFEYNFKDAYTSRVKLNLIELLISKSKTIIIVSDIHPVSFLQSNAEFDPKTSPEEQKRMQQDIDRWARLLGSFFNYYYNIAEKDDILYKNNETLSPAENTIASECRFGNFLSKAKWELLKDAEVKKFTEKEDVLWKIQSHALLYYHGIWSTLTKEEQYIIYDVAQDGILNTKNINIIKVLYEKGLLIAENGSEKITLFNESFQNFILTEVRSEDVLAIEKTLREQGTWTNYRTPILIILVALIVFVLSTQQDSFNSLLGYVSIFATGIAFFQRILSVFSFKVSKI